MFQVPTPVGTTAVAELPRSAASRRICQARCPILILLSRLAIVLAIFATTAQAQRTEARFRSPECRLAFDHPADWEVVRDTSDRQDPCRFAVRPRDWQQRVAANDSIDVYTIVLQIVARGVWAQMAESGFRQRGRGWVVLGRQDMEQPADTVSGTGWTGVRGMATQGCYREAGAYAGLCDQPTALVGTSNRSVLIIGGAQSEDTFNRILATLQFQ